MVFTFAEWIDPPEWDHEEYTEEDAYTDWVGEQPEGADTSREAWEEHQEQQFDPIAF